MSGHNSVASLDLVWKRHEISIYLPEKLMMPNVMRPPNCSLYTQQATYIHNLVNA